MQPLLMANDVGGMVYVGKNELVIKFSKGVKHTIRVNTKELWQLLNSQSDDDWENDKVLIEPTYVDMDTWKAFVLITVKNTGQDDDIAEVFQNDFKEALKTYECL